MINIILDENGLSFNSLEKEIYSLGCQAAREMLKNTLEEMDGKLAQERDKAKYRHKGSRQTTLKTLMGEVNFSRTVYESRDDEGHKTYIYLLDKILRSGVDWVARYGGDEFLICLHVGEEVARKILDRMRRGIENANVEAHDTIIKMTSSFGVCTMMGNYKSPEEMIKCADYKLYNAKNDGKNRIAQ